MQILFTFLSTATEKLENQSETNCEACQGLLWDECHISETSNIAVFTLQKMITSLLGTLMLVTQQPLESWLSAWVYLVHSV